jgi:phospholipid/cholesterol/gamma-HCH transport system substrate-binding protein
MTRKVVRVAIFSAACVALIALVGFQISKVSFGGRYALTATFTDATGLFINDDVRLAGVTVGKVTGIRVVDGDEQGRRAKIDFEINNDVRLPTDSQASVRWRNLLGQRFLYVIPGEASEMLSGGDRIHRTVDVVDFGRLVNNLGPLANALDPHQLSEVLRALSEAVEGNEDNLDGLIGDLNAFMGVLAQRESTISQLIGDYEKVTGVLARRDEQIQTMVDNLLLLTETFAGHSDILEDALAELSITAEGLDVLLTRNSDELASIVRNLSLVTASATNKVTELESAFTAIPETTRQLFTVADSGNFLKVNFVCLALDPPTSPDAPECPHELLVPEDQTSASTAQARSAPSASILQPGPGRLVSLADFARLLVGVSTS